MRLFLVLLVVSTVGTIVSAAEPVITSGLPTFTAEPLQRIGDSRYRFGGVLLACQTSPDRKRHAILSFSQTSRIAIVTILDAARGEPRVISRLSPRGGEPFARPMLAYSPDGQKLAVRFNSETVFVLDTATAQVLWQLQNPQKTSYSYCAFDSEGRLLLVLDSTTELHDISTGELVRVFPVGGIATLTPDRKTYVRTKKVYAEVEIGDLATGQARHVLPIRASHNGRENGSTFSHDGKTVAIIDSLARIVLVDVKSGESKSAIPIPKEFIPAQQTEYVSEFSPDDKYLSLSSPGWFTTWQLETLKMVLSKTNLRKTYYRGWIHSADGKTVLLPEMGSLHPWSIEKNATADPTNLGAIMAFALSHDGKQIVLGHSSGFISVWDTVKNEFLRMVETTRPVDGPIPRMLLSPNGKYLAYSAGMEGCQVTPVGLAAQSGPPVSTSVGGAGNLIWWSADSKRVCYLARTRPGVNEFVEYDVLRQSQVRTLPQLRTPVWVSQDGVEVVSLLPQKEFPQIVGESRLMAYVDNLDRGTNSLWPAAKRYATEGHRAALVPYRLRQRPNTQDFAFVNLFQSDNAMSTSGLGFLPATGKSYYANQQMNREPALGSPKVPEVARRDVVQASGSTPSPTNIEFTPSGHWVITCDVQDTMSVWEYSTGRRVKSFLAQEGPISHLAIAPDGRSVFSLGGDGSLCRWSLEPEVWYGPKEPEALWRLLHQPDARDGVSVAWTLIGDVQLREYVVQKLPAVPQMDPKKFRSLLDDLDAPAFAVRKNAKHELGMFVRSIETDLTEELKITKSVEVRERLEELLAIIDRGYTPGELAASRLVQACEWHRVYEPLKLWAAGAPSAVLTREAKAALARMK